MSHHSLADQLVDAIGAVRVSTDADVLRAHGQDGTRQGRDADVVVFPESTAHVVAVATLCSERRTPMVARGAGTGYSGGAVPIRGGVVLSFARMNRIHAIEPDSLYAVVEPGVVTGDLQDAVARAGLFYPPDPSSLRQCTIGGNVAENAGGPRAFKYGVTRNYVLGLEAVLAGGEVIRTGGKTVKNVVGYDLTQLLVGSEGTLAIVTEITLRLVSLPPAVATLRAYFPSIRQAAEAVSRLVRAHAVPATLEIVDGATLDAVARATGDRRLAPPGAGAMLIVECDGLPESVAAEAAVVAEACRHEGATDVVEARVEAEREELWRVRRAISPALMVVAGLKLNNDIVVPRARVPELFALVEDLKRRFVLPIPSFGHAGDGNIHVNVMANPDDEVEVARAHAAVDALVDGVLALGGSISGEHGIGLSKAGFIDRELSGETLGAMRRLKRSLDPLDILNPGKIFPEFAPARRETAASGRGR